MLMVMLRGKTKLQMPSETPRRFWQVSIMMGRLAADDDVEKAMILKAIDFHEGNLTRVARALGLSRGALYRRMEKYGLET